MIPFFDVKAFQVATRPLNVVVFSQSKTFVWNVNPNKLFIDLEIYNPEYKSSKGTIYLLPFPPGLTKYPSRYKQKVAVYLYQAAAFELLQIPDRALLEKYGDIDYKKYVQILRQYDGERLKSPYSITDFIRRRLGTSVTQNISGTSLMKTSERLEVSVLPFLKVGNDLFNMPEFGSPLPSSFFGDWKNFRIMVNGEPGELNFDGLKLVVTQLN